MTDDNKGNSPHAFFDVAWSVSDIDGDLQQISLTLKDVDEGDTEAIKTIGVSGSSESGTTKLKVNHEEDSGHTYQVTITVTDRNGNTASETASATQ
jgi:subtilisin